MNGTRHVQTLPGNVSAPASPAPPLSQDEMEWRQLLLGALAFFALGFFTGLLGATVGARARPSYVVVDCDSRVSQLCPVRP